MAGDSGGGEGGSGQGGGGQGGGQGGQGGQSGGQSGGDGNSGNGDSGNGQGNGQQGGGKGDTGKGNSNNSDSNNNTTTSVVANDGSGGRQSQFSDTSKNSPSLNGIYNSDGQKTSSFVDNGHGVYTKSVDTYDDRGNKINQDYVDTFYTGKDALSDAERTARNRANGINDWGKNMDKNNDGKIGFFENMLMSVTNAAKAVDKAFGGTDIYGYNKAGNINGAKQSRAKNMAQNFADAMNKAFGGIGKYDGTTKNGEHYAPGTKADFASRMATIGKGILTGKGKTWNDANHDGKMDGKEMGKAALANLAINAISKAPLVGKATGSFLSGAVSDGSRAQSGFWGQLGQQVATNNKGVSNPSVSVGPSTSGNSGPSNNNNRPTSELENAIIKPALNDAKNFRANMKQHTMDVPLTSATYVSRKDNKKDPAVTVSDERCKEFAKRRLFR